MKGWRFSSAFAGMAWPALPGARGSAVLALLHQLEATERLPAERLEALQLSQLAPLLQHAHRSTTFYPGHWGARYDPASHLDAAAFRKLPVLTRQHLQQHYEEIKSSNLPASHDGAIEGKTSGSSGAPVRVLKTGLTGIVWRALTLREHAWHRRDMAGKLAVIRRRAGGRQDNWGGATDHLVVTGPVVGKEPETPVGELLQWLEREQPDYLLTYPSIVGELARAAAAQGRRLPSLKQVRTLGELLPEEVRALCREAWGVSLTDVYSCEEAGYLALQCPQHEHYHVQSENVLLEVLDDAGQPCRTGEIGRVVVTALHNFATPLVRYDVGDFAEVGPPCACGRGLPVLRRIVGRTRNIFVTASGERFWPSFSSRRLDKIASIRQHQFVQKAYDLVEARLVVAAPLSAAQEAALREVFLQRLPPGTRLEFSYPASIERSAGGKYEDFKSEIAG